MASREIQRAAELRAGVYDYEYLIGLKNGRKKSVLDFCMEKNLIASQYVCPKCGENMSLSVRSEMSTRRKPRIPANDVSTFLEYFY